MKSKGEEASLLGVLFAVLSLIAAEVVEGQEDGLVFKGEFVELGPALGLLLYAVADVPLFLLLHPIF